MTDAADLHQEQIAYWNSGGGERWVTAQEHTDKMLAPVSKLLLEIAKPVQGMAVLDIGCGGGATTIELAKAVGTSGRVLGVDVSAPLIECAKARLSPYPQAELLLADASAHPFSPFAELAVSRFGVMFFGDPIPAFSNIRKALKPGGRLVFACWRDFHENPWMKTPLDAILSAGVPKQPRPGPDEPGPFSLADPERVRRILIAAGFQRQSLSAADISFDIASGKGLAAAVRQAITIGPAAAALREQPQAIHNLSAKLVEAAIKPYQNGESVSLPGAIWIVEASAS